MPPGVDAELLNEALFRKLAVRVEEPLRAKAGGALAAILRLSCAGAGGDTKLYVPSFVAFFYFFVFCFLFFCFLFFIFILYFLFYFILFPFFAQSRVFQRVVDGKTGVLALGIPTERTR